MAFEARPLRVQLPCKSVTVIDEDDFDVGAEARKYWRGVAIGMQAGFDLGEMKCEECSANPSEPLCTNASEELDIRAIMDIRVFPILRRQLEARLKEIEEAEAALAKGGGG